MQPSRLLVLFGLVVALVMGGCRSEGQLGRQLSGSEIQTLFADRTVMGHHDRHGYDFRSYYERDGRFRSHQSDKSAMRNAKWWIAGDDICIRWEDTANEDLCRRMFVDDKGTYRKVKITPGGERIVVVTFASFAPGNAERL